MKAKLEEKSGDKGKLSWIAALSGFFWRRFSCIEEAKLVEAISDGWIMTEKGKSSVKFSRRITDLAKRTYLCNLLLS